MRIATIGWRLIACLVISQAAAGEAARQLPRFPFGTGRPIAQPHVVPGNQNKVARPHAFMLAPVINSITPDHGRQGDVVVITGANFHAPNYNPKVEPNPLDPGFTIVRFGKVVAPHIEITSTRLTVFVPRMPEGAVIVIIQNRFGFSNAVPFTVERAWWDFWSPKPGQ